MKRVPDWQPWLVYFLGTLAEQVSRLNRKIERERLVLATLPEPSLQIVEMISVSPFPNRANAFISATSRQRRRHERDRPTL